MAAVLLHLTWDPEVPATEDLEESHPEGSHPTEERPAMVEPSQHTEISTQTTLMPTMTAEAAVDAAVTPPSVAPPSSPLPECPRVTAEVSAQQVPMVVYRPLYLLSSLTPSRDMLGAIQVVRV